MKRTRWVKFSERMPKPTQKIVARDANGTEYKGEGLNRFDFIVFQDDVPKCIDWRPRK